MACDIIMYTAKICSDCQHLKAFMDANGIPYEARDIKDNPEYAQELQEKTGKLGVPYLVINGEWKRGYVPGQVFSETFGRELFGLA